MVQAGPSAQGFAVRGRAPVAWPVGLARPVAPAAGAMKRTYQPKKQRRARRHGFRHRMQTRAGRAVLRSRRQKGRARLSA